MFQTMRGRFFVQNDNLTLHDLPFSPPGMTLHKPIAVSIPFEPTSTTNLKRIERVNEAKVLKKSHLGIAHGVFNRKKSESNMRKRTAIPSMTGTDSLCVSANRILSDGGQTARINDEHNNMLSHRHSTSEIEQKSVLSRESNKKKYCLIQSNNNSNPPRIKKIANQYYAYNYAVGANSQKHREENVILSGLVPNTDMMRVKRNPVHQLPMLLLNNDSSYKEIRMKKWEKHLELHDKIELAPNQYQNPNITKRLNKINEEIEKMKKVKFPHKLVAKITAKYT